MRDVSEKENMDGTEYGLDTYIDSISRGIVSIFAKEKKLVGADERTNLYLLKI